MVKFAILVALIYLSGIALAVFSGSHWAVYLYQIVYFLNPENRWWSSSLPSISYSYITVIVLFITFFLNRNKYTLNKLHELPQFKWLILLSIIYSLAYFYAVDQQAHKQALIEFIKMLVILSVAYKILDTSLKLEWSLLAYILGAGYIGYEAFVVGRNSGDRLEGIGLIDAPEANGTAAAIVASIPLIIYFLWWGNKKIKLAMIVLAPFIANGLILLNSRGAFVGVAAGVLHFMWTMIFSRFKFKHQKKISLAIILLGLSGTLYLVDDAFIDRMATLANPEDEGASGSHRYHIWLSTFDLLEDYPFGVGAYGFEKLSPNYVDESLFFYGQKFKAVHSIWFQALGEIGWHGFIIFCLLIISTYLALRRIKRKCKKENDHHLFYLGQALQSAFVTLLVTSSFINQFRVQIIYWFILFTACLYSIVINNAQTRYKKEVEEHVDTQIPGVVPINNRLTRNNRPENNMLDP